MDVVTCLPCFFRWLDIITLIMNISYKSVWTICTLGYYLHSRLLRSGALWNFSKLVECRNFQIDWKGTTHFKPSVLSFTSSLLQKTGWYSQLKNTLRCEAKTSSPSMRTNFDALIKVRQRAPTSIDCGRVRSPCHVTSASSWSQRWPEVISR